MRYFFVVLCLLTLLKGVLSVGDWSILDDSGSIDDFAAQEFAFDPSLNTVFCEMRTEFLEPGTSTDHTDEINSLRFN